MEKNAVHQLLADDVRKHLISKTESERLAIIRPLYRSLPANLGMSIEEFQALVSEFAPSFSPDADDHDSAIREHAMHPGTLQAIKKAAPETQLDFLHKIEYILQSGVEDQTRREAENLLTKVTTHYFK
jgi:hypothetical protein